MRREEEEAKRGKFSPKSNRNNNKNEEKARSNSIENNQSMSSHNTNKQLSKPTDCSEARSIKGDGQRKSQDRSHTREVSCQPSNKSSSYQSYKPNYNYSKAEAVLKQGETTPDRPAQRYGRQIQFERNNSREPGSGPHRGIDREWHQRNRKENFRKENRCNNWNREGNDDDRGFRSKSRDRPHFVKKRDQKGFQKGHQPYNQSFNKRGRY